MFSMLGAAAAAAVGDESSEKVPMLELELGDPVRKPFVVEPFETVLAFSLREAMEVAEVGYM